MKPKGGYLPTIYLPVEIKAREFKAKVLLAGFAARAGFRVYLGTKSAVDKLVARKPSKGGVYFYKGGKPIEVLNGIREKTSAFVVLDEEMGPMVESLEMAYRKRIYPGTEHLIDRLFVIGERHRDVIAAVRPMLLSACRVTGWPRVDLWTPRFTSSIEEGSRNITARFGRFLLFSSNFGVLTEEAANRELAVIQRVPTKDDEVAYYETVYSRGLEEFRYIVKLLKAADADPEIPAIVVRPHPSEDEGQWRAALGALTKVHVVFEGDISSWLQASSGLLHRGCTTALQAYATQRPSIFIETPGVEIDRKSLAHRLSIASRDLPSLRSAAVDAIAGRLQSAPIDVDYDVFIDPDKPAAEHVVRSLLDLPLVHEPSFSSEAAWVKRAGGMIAHALRTSFNSRYRDTNRRKMPGGVHVGEVKALLGSLGFLSALASEIDFNLVEIREN